MPEPERASQKTESAKESALRARLRNQLSKVSPEWTRRSTPVEAMTVGRLSWETLVRLNRVLEVAGRLATFAYFLFLATIVIGVDWKHLVEVSVNSGRPVRGAVALALLIPTLLFVALHSLTGYGRWRVQRELWRRDVERLNRDSS
jgi:hypothetical protein